MMVRQSKIKIKPKPIKNHNKCTNHFDRRAVISDRSRCAQSGGGGGGGVLFHLLSVIKYIIMSMRGVTETKVKLITCK